MQSKRTEGRASEPRKDWPSWKQLRYALQLMAEAAGIEAPDTAQEVSDLIDRLKEAQPVATSDAAPF